MTATHARNAAPWHSLFLVNVATGEVVSTTNDYANAAREAVLDLHAFGSGGMAGFFGPFATSEEAERYAGPLSPEEADAASGAGLDVDAIDWTDAP